MKHIIHCLILFPLLINARTVNYQLTVAEKNITIKGKTSTALAINDSIPSPTLYFNEGDVARIEVRNNLKKEPTSLHWHGLLLPNDQDGVPFLTTPQINPGDSLTYYFPLTHPGTYWYHSHAGLQEQRGLYGAIVVRPKIQTGPPIDRDYVVVLSDFTHENPSLVMRTLMRGSNNYAIRKGTMQSITGAIRAGSLADYWEREKSRMLPMDVSDIAYDAFLINGHEQQFLLAKPHDRVRLRLINAGAATYFFVHSAFPQMTIVAADGNEVRPIKTNRLLMGIGETYDIIVTMPDSGSCEIRATAQDVSGHASLMLGSGAERMAENIVRPNYYNMEHMLAQSLDMNDDPLHPNASPYKYLRSLHKTGYGKNHPTRSIDLHLTGDMERYRWSFNDKTLNEESTILVKRGEVLRINLVNDSMMHHPIHLHGHFFRMINEAGAYSPLKHTVDLPPMGARTIEFLANEKGDWFFHCHLLYHMDAGMARVISYDDQGADHRPDLGPSAYEPWYWMVDGAIQSNMTMGMAGIMWGRENFILEWERAMGDHGANHDDIHHHHPMEMKEHKGENNFVWSHYFDPNVSSMVGYRFSLENSEDNRFFAGVSYRLPYLISTELSLNNSGEARIALRKSLQITERLELIGRLQYDSADKWEHAVSAEYTLTKNLGLTGGYDSNHGWGAGLGFHF